MTAIPGFSPISYDLCYLAGASPKGGELFDEFISSYFHPHLNAHNVTFIAPKKREGVTYGIGLACLSQAAAGIASNGIKTLADHRIKSLSKFSSVLPLCYKIMTYLTLIIPLLFLIAAFVLFCLGLGRCRRIRYQEDPQFIQDNLLNNKDYQEEISNADKNLHSFSTLFRHLFFQTQSGVVDKSPLLKKIGTPTSHEVNANFLARLRSFKNNLQREAPALLEMIATLQKAEEGPRSSWKTISDEQLQAMNHFFHPNLTCQKKDQGLFLEDLLLWKDLIQQEALLIDEIIVELERTRLMPDASIKVIYEVLQIMKCQEIRCFQLWLVPDNDEVVGHAITLMCKKNDENNFIFAVYNTGYGVENHVMIADEALPFVRKEVTLEALLQNEDLCRALFFSPKQQGMTLEEKTKLFYAAIGRMGTTMEPLSRYKLQRGVGNCPYKSMSVVLRKWMKDPLYQRFKIFMMEEELCELEALDSHHTIDSFEGRYRLSTVEYKREIDLIKSEIAFSKIRLELKVARLVQIRLKQQLAELGK